MKPGDRLAFGPENILKNPLHDFCTQILFAPVHQHGDGNWLCAGWKQARKKSDFRLTLNRLGLG